MKPALEADIRVDSLTLSGIFLFLRYPYYTKKGNAMDTSKVATKLLAKAL
jgi:hypothetical protein